MEIIVKYVGLLSFRNKFISRNIFKGQKYDQVPVSKCAAKENHNLVEGIVEEPPNRICYPRHRKSIDGGRN